MLRKKKNKMPNQTQGGTCTETDTCCEYTHNHITHSIMEKLELLWLTNIGEDVLSGITWWEITREKIQFYSAKDGRHTASLIS
jgi:hypothetical protein